jgi:hypothetical protein
VKHESDVSERKENREINGRTVPDLRAWRRGVIDSLIVVMGIFFFFFLSQNVAKSRDVHTVFNFRIFSVSMDMEKTRIQRFRVFSVPIFL